MSHLVVDDRPDRGFKKGLLLSFNVSQADTSKLSYLIVFGILGADGTTCQRGKEIWKLVTGPQMQPAFQLNKNDVSVEDLQEHHSNLLDKKIRSAFMSLCCQGMSW